MPRAYLPVTAYTATRPIIVNGVDINTGLYPVLNFKPEGAQYPYIYVPIAEFSRVGANVVWDPVNQLINVTTDYYQLKEREKELIQENERLRQMLNTQHPKTKGNTAGNIMNWGTVAQQGDWIYYGRLEYWSEMHRALYKEEIDGTERQKLLGNQPKPDPYYINVLGDWVYYVDNNSRGIYKVRIDGTELTKLSDVFPSNLIVINDWIYYIGEGSSIYRMKTDGSQVMPLNDESSSSINVVDNYIYYGNGADRNTFYRMTVEGEEQTKLSNISGAFYLVHNNFVYFINLDDNRNIYRMGLAGSNPRKLSDDAANIMNISDEYIFYTIPASPPGGDLYRMRLDGSERTSMNVEFVIDINIHGDWLYYRASRLNLYRIKTTGGSPEVIYEARRT